MHRHTAPACQQNNSIAPKYHHHIYFRLSTPKLNTVSKISPRGWIPPARNATRSGFTQFAAQSALQLHHAAQTPTPRHPISHSGGFGSGAVASHTAAASSSFGTPAAQRRTKTGYSCANRLRHSARPGGGRRGGGRRRPPARPGRRRRAPPPPAPTRATTPPPAPPCASPTSAAPPPERKDMKSAKCVILGGTAARRTGWPARKSRWLRPLPAGMPPASAPNATVLGPPPTLCGASAFLTSCAPHAATPGP